MQKTMLQIKHKKEVLGLTHKNRHLLKMPFAFT